jgi:hypothetical protein
VSGRARWCTGHQQQAEPELVLERVKAKSTHGSATALE